MSCPEILNEICKVRVGNERAFIRRKTAAIAAKAEWDEKGNVRIRQTIYGAEDFKYWGPRHDFVSCRTLPCVNYGSRAAEFPKIGEVEGFPYSESGSEPDVAILRKVSLAEYQDGNRKIAEFGYIPLKYDWDTTDALLIRVPSLSLGRRINVVQDIFEVIQRRKNDRRMLLSYLDNTP